jgi:hypothetical protein
MNYASWKKAGSVAPSPVPACFGLGANELAGRNENGVAGAVRTALVELNERTPSMLLTVLHMFSCAVQETAYGGRSCMRMLICTSVKAGDVSCDARHDRCTG